MILNDVKINHGSLQSDWTSATSWRHWRCSAVSRKTGRKCFPSSILALISDFSSTFWLKWMYEGWSKSSFLFMIQRKIRILSKFCDVHIEIKYISSNWMLFEKQLWRHSLWHVTYLKASSSWIVFRVSLLQNLRYLSAVKSTRYLLETRIWNY